MEFFFHKQYEIFTPKRPPTSNSCCFKTNEAIELEPKPMKYFIYSAPEYFNYLYYYSYTDRQKTIKATHFGAIKKKKYWHYINKND